jgi:hypothetical protein
MIHGNSQFVVIDEQENTSEQEREQMIAIVKTHGRISVRTWIAECKALCISKDAFYAHRRYLEEEVKAIEYEDGKGGVKLYRLVRAAQNSRAA